MIKKLDRSSAVYPFGTGKLANTLVVFKCGKCCGHAMAKKIDDIEVTRRFLVEPAKVANDDADRIFARGLSNGGIMSHFVASELSDRLAAINPVGGPLMIDAPRNQRPVSIMHFHGTADAFAPFKGGIGKGSLIRKRVKDFRSVDLTIQFWVNSNGCKTEPEIAEMPDRAEDGLKLIRKSGSVSKVGSEAVLIEMGGGGYTWSGQKPSASLLGSSSLDNSESGLMWKFFQKRSRKRK